MTVGCLWALPTLTTCSRLIFEGDVLLYVGIKYLILRIPVLGYRLAW